MIGKELIVSDKLLSKYSGRTAASTAADATTTAEADIIDDLGAFGWLRGTRDRALMLELRKANGDILAVGYGWLDRVEFDPSKGITLHLGGRQIRIRGRNLNAEMRPPVRLFRGIIQHRVAWVQEADAAVAMREGKDDTAIEKIDW
jgi:hypothetical protein